MDTTSLIVSSAIGAVILFFVARVILKRNKEAMLLEEDLNKDELFTLKQETNDFFVEPDEQRFVPDEEIESYADEKEIDIAQVINHLIRNEIKNLDKIEFYDLQESILIADFGELSNRFSVDHIYQVGEKKFVAILSVCELSSDETVNIY